MKAILVRNPSRFNSLHAIAAAGLLLGGLGTATSRAAILYEADGNIATSFCRKRGSVSLKRGSIRGGCVLSGERGNH